MTTQEQYDSSWDWRESNKMSEEQQERAYEKKYAEWVERKWKFWLRDHLTFPFEAVRKDDDDDAIFTNIAETQPFRLGHTMQVQGIEHESAHYGVIVRVKEGNAIGRVPLCDLEVTSKENANFWPVREYVVWYANQ